MNLTYKEFLEYLENDFDGYEIFMEKATEYQQNKNQKRKPGFARTSFLNEINSNLPHIPPLSGCFPETGGGRSFYVRCSIRAA